jgi:hypothetical protein
VGIIAKWPAAPAAPAPAAAALPLPTPPPLPPLPVDTPSFFVYFLTAPHPTVLGLASAARRLLESSKSARRRHRRQQAHWKARPFGHRGRCVAPKHRKPSAFKSEEARDETDVSKLTEKDLCGVCHEPLLLLTSGAPHAGTQTLVYKHLFHLNCAAELKSLSNPVCHCAEDLFRACWRRLCTLTAKKRWA